MKEQSFENRRQYPRLKTNINAIVSSSSGNEFPTIISDLSPDGAQIIYRGKEDSLLYEKNANYHALKNLTLILKFKLPYLDNELIEINAKPIHHHHLGTHKYIVGMIFDKNNIEQKNKIMDYLVFEASPSSEEIKQVHENEKISPAIKGKSNVEKQKNNNNRKINNTHNEEGKREIDFNLKHELNLLSTTLNSLTNSIRLIEEKLERIERSISKNN